MYDTVAAYYLLRPSVFQYEPMDIVIETKGEHTFGMTIAENRISKKKNFNVDVVVKTNRRAFLKDFIKIIRS